MKFRYNKCYTLLKRKKKVDHLIKLSKKKKGKIMKYFNILKYENIFFLDKRVFCTHLRK